MTVNEQFKALQNSIELDKQLAVSKPAVILKQVVMPDACPSCVAVAVVDYEGQEHTLSDGDTFVGYRVAVIGNRLVLADGKHQFTYFADTP